MNGKKFFRLLEDFTYYYSPIIKRVSTKFVPLGDTSFYLIGNKFLSGYSGENLTCKLGGQNFKAKFISSQKVQCLLNGIKFKVNFKKHNHFHITFSGNGQNFFGTNKNIYIKFYSLKSITPNSGPVTGKTSVKIIIK